MPGTRAADIYERHAVGLYRQAVVTLGDTGMAGLVLAEVLADEYERPEAHDEVDVVGCRLAVSVYWRCQKVAGSPGIGPGVGERGALALVLFGGMEYREASRELAIPASEMAAMVRAALHGLAGVSPGRPQA